MAWPVDEPLVNIEAEKGPVQGAGITWAILDGKSVITVEFQIRDREPMQFHLSEQDDGTFEIQQPPVYLLPRQPEDC